MDMASDTGLTVVVPQLVHQIAVTGLMDTTPIDNDSGSEHDEDTDGPPMKQRKMDVDFDFNSGASLKQIMFTINKAITIRLDSIERSLSALRNTQKGIEDKLDMLLGTVKQPNGANLSPNQNKKGAVIVGLPQQNGADTGAGDGSGILQDADIKPSFDGIQNLGPNVTLITLNCEEDHPNGTWLGDETNPEMRVRVIVSPSDLPRWLCSRLLEVTPVYPVIAAATRREPCDLLHIHSNCRTPEKMALTLLDYLFDRETQAMSNLSGMGKHGKRQLDPLMIYGIRCHLITKFGISENEWHRIKQNVDSKCRTAFRRKQRGMPMQVKAFRGKSNSFISATNATEMIAGEIDQSDEDSLSHEDSLHIHHGGEMYLQGDLDIQQAVAMQGDGTGLPAEVQILHATPEQICQLQQAQHIQILQGDHVIQVPVPQHIQQLTSSELHESIQVAVSMPQVTDSMSLQTIAVDASDLAAVQPQ